MEVRPVDLPFDTQGSASPLPRPPRTWAGRGSGVACSSCDQPIGEQDIEYEVELQPAGLQTLHFHFNCYQAWVVQRVRDSVAD